MSEKVRWGVLSTARIGEKAVIPAIQASGNGELVAVASREEGRARSFAGEVDVPTSFGSYQGLLDSDEVDAVYIPLPNSLHKEWTLRAAEKGKHILCEKPLGLTAAECLEMAASAEANGVKLMEAFMYRFHPRTEQALAVIRGGGIGDLRQIRSTFTFELDRADDIRWDAELGGGALMDVGCYCVNVSRTVVGREPVEVRAMANLGESGVDTQMAGSLRFDDGLLAHFDCALTMDRTQIYHAMGTHGHLRVLKAFVLETEDTVIEQFDAEDNLTSIPVPGADEYRLMVEHFADCVLHDRPVRYPPEEAARNMAVIEALYESARNDGAEVEVTPPA
jgi:predicted dehydrogenase